MMYKRLKLVAMIIVICMLVTMLPAGAVEKYEASEKVTSELLELMNVTYEDLSSGNFEDTGEMYSCIIWIQDVEIEEAVEAGINAAEQTKEGYSTWSLYDYPYTTYEVDGLTYVDVSLDDDADDEYVQTYIETERETATELYTANNNSFVAENFMARDMSVTYVSRYSPCIFAELSVTKIADLIENDEVLCINCISNGELEVGSSNSNISLSTDEIQESIEVIRVDEAWDYFLVNGDGVKIGQIEPWNPNSSAVTRNTQYKSTTAVEDEHADNVHLIMSTVAPNATYYSTGTTENSGTMYEQIEWLLDQGVNIINMSASYQDGSYSTYDASDMWVDHIAYNHDVHFVVISGNKMYLGVESPGMAYNAITVGVTRRTSNYEIMWEYDNKGNLWGSAYNSDGLSLTEHTTYKPDIVAPGEYTGDWGTSYSTPLVTGTIALMCDYQPALKTKQFVVKALLAGTTGSSTRKYVSEDDPFFKMYGAGIVDAHSALYAVYKRKYSTSTGSLTNAGDSKTYSMTVTSSDTCMRIAVAHSNRVEFSSSQEHDIPAKLGRVGTIGIVAIRVYDPSGTEILSTYDSSFINGANLQVVEFDPREYGTGTYTIKVILKQAASGGARTNFGIAWR